MQIYFAIYALKVFKKVDPVTITRKRTGKTADFAKLPLKYGKEITCNKHDVETVRRMLGYRDDAEQWLMEYQ